MPSQVLSRRPAKRARADWYAKAKVLHDQGMNISQIARKLGISRSFASSLIHDPDGSKDKQRKSGYAGVCVDCGGATHGGEGFEHAPERCGECRWEYQRQQKYWTRERVIAAIQRWAEEHGRPPISTDWMHAGEGHPAATSVYRTSAQKSAPFKSWADAVEAAGFPRPTVVYERSGFRGLAHAQWWVLGFLHAHRAGVTASALAETRGVKLNTMQRTLNSLVARGLLTVEKPPRVPGRRGGTAYVYRLSDAARANAGSFKLPRR